MFSKDFVFVFPDPATSFIYLQSEAQNGVSTDFQSNDSNLTVTNGEGVLTKAYLSGLTDDAIEVTVDSTQSIALLLEGKQCLDYQ